MKIEERNAVVFLPSYADDIEGIEVIWWGIPTSQEEAAKQLTDLAVIARSQKSEILGVFHPAHLGALREMTIYATHEFLEYNKKPVKIFAYAGDLSVEWKEYLIGCI